MSSKLPTPEVRFQSISMQGVTAYIWLLTNLTDYEPYGYSNVFISETPLDLLISQDESIRYTLGDAASSIGTDELIIAAADPLPYSYSITLSCEGYENSETVSGTFTGES